MRDLVQSYLSKAISRRGFLDNMKNAGISVAAAELVLSSLNEAQAQTQTQAPQRSRRRRPALRRR